MFFNNMHTAFETFVEFMRPFSEPALAPAFHELVERLLADIPAAAGLTVVPEYTNPGVGRPDIALMRAGVPARAFVELKAPEKPANPTLWRIAHDRRQFERLKELRCWASSNFIDLFLFDRGEEQGHRAYRSGVCA